MKSLGKTEALHVRLTPDQRRRIDRAAGLVSREKGEIVEPSTLFRQLGMEGVDAILSNAQRSAA